MAKKKRKNLTTKNTHGGTKGREVNSQNKPISARTRIYAIIAVAVLLIVLKACDNNSPGYDRWIGMPLIWR